MFTKPWAGRETVDESAPNLFELFGVHLPGRRNRVTQMNTESLNRFAPQALAVLRIVAALLYVLHGSQKLLAFPLGQMPGPVPLLSLFGIGGVLELVGGLLLLVGLFTRPVAFLLSGQMAVAYWMFHAPGSLYPTNNGGDAAILFCFFFLYLVFSGPGAWALDEKLGKGRLTPSAA
jgi:putative oxidoreductase